VIELAAEAEFDIRSHGNRIEIRVPRLSPLLGLRPRATDRPQASDLRPQAPDNDTENATPPTATAAANPNENENPNPNPNPNQTPSPNRTPELQSEAQKRASLPTVALVGSRPVASAPISAADKRRRDREERMLAYAADQREAAAKSVQASAERKAAHFAAQSAAQEKARAAAERAVADRIAAAAAAAERRAASLSAQRAAAEKLAEKSRPAADPTRAAPRQRTVAMAEPSRRSITGIGFRPRARGQVIVHSNQPLEYGVSGGDNNALLLHLPSAGIPLANNRRALDTRFFGGPVQRVVPLAVPGGTDVRIELSEHADYQLEQSGSILTVTFSARP
jgi:hypothetical protein